MNAPGSPSSALQTTYFWSALLAAANFHGAGGNPPPRAASLTANHIDHILRFHFGERLGQRHIAVKGDVFVVFSDR